MVYQDVENFLEEFMEGREVRSILSLQESVLRDSVIEELGQMEDECIFNGEYLRVGVLRIGEFRVICYSKVEDGDWDYICCKDAEVYNKVFESYLDRNLIYVMTIREMCDLYGYKHDTVLRFMKRGAKGLREGLHYRKSGATWLLTKEGVYLYRKMRENIASLC